MSLTAIDTLVEALSPPPAADTAYVVAVAIAVGSPEIVPLLGSKASPAGRAGLMVNELKEPVVLGATGVIAVPTTNVCVPEG
jgi:hypothetical protein